MSCWLRQIRSVQVQIIKLMDSSLLLPASLFSHLIIVFQLALYYHPFCFLFNFRFLFHFPSFILSYLPSRCLRLMVTKLLLHRGLPSLWTQLPAPRKTWRQEKNGFFFRRGVLCSGAPNWAVADYNLKSAHCFDVLFFN